MSLLPLHPILHSSFFIIHFLCSGSEWWATRGRQKSNKSNIINPNYPHENEKIWSKTSLLHIYRTKAITLMFRLGTSLPWLQYAGKKGLCLLCCEVCVLASGGRYFISGAAGQDHLILWCKQSFILFLLYVSLQGMSKRWKCWYQSSF